MTTATQPISLENSVVICEPVVGDVDTGAEERHLAEAVDSDAAEHREKEKCHVVESGTLRAKMGMNSDPQDVKIVVGVNLREGEVLTEMSMDRGNGRMRSGMNRTDGAHEKVIHVKTILSTSTDHGRGSQAPPPELLDRLAAMGVVRPSARVVDLGTGTGSLARGAVRLTAIVADDEAGAMAFWQAAGYEHQQHRARLVRPPDA